MKNSKQLSNTILVLTVAALLSACAPRGSGSTDQASRIPDATNTTSGTKGLAQCNQASDNGITAKLRAYVDPSTNKVRMDYMIVRFTALPSTFTSDTSYISMWRWLSNASGNTYLDSTPLNFLIINPKTGLAITNWKSTIRWADVRTAAANLGYSDATTFFNAMKIVVDLKDVNGDYDVLRVSNYDIATNKSVGQVDALLPIFYANPADYAKEADGSARASSLYNLHPFKSYANSGYSSSQFVSMADSYCF
ncbi:hypothetical protein AZI86_18550 [Bdellovibrio bacteriovorus]|uniref:Lipoprotein n=1 Tax=Bdellovibrio bacteriovorus TaxID=959 RepID=A0A150WFF0_BDEBC|nr:hypothetical protein [Bdellovibrio bacteriovorus]KYG61694.1 hypothetical protein AZI86_18550 [Bdellovibrio bacteriovorus]